MNRIHKAAGEGDLEAIRALLDDGASVNAPDPQGATPLHHACEHGYLSSVRLLLEAGADLNARNREELRPVDVAVAFNHDHLMEALIHVPSDPKTTAYDHWTLCQAAGWGKDTIVRKLVGIGLNVDAMYDEEPGTTPLHMALQEGHVHVVGTLLELGAEVNRLDDSGTNHLDQAAAMGHQKIAEILIDAGADVNLRIPAGEGTALHSACAWGQLDLVELLLERGADVEISDDEGMTPVFRAAVNGHRDVCELLVARGADIRRRNANGKTLSALVQGNSELLKLFRE